MTKRERKKLKILHGGKVKRDSGVRKSTRNKHTGKNNRESWYRHINIIIMYAIVRGAALY